MNILYGTGVALVTPFTKSGAIDYASLERLLVHTARGADYYVVMGTTGESATMTGQEKKDVLEFIKAHNPKKLPLVYGIGGNNTAQVVQEVGQANLKGVDALLSVSPYYNKPSQEGIYQHFKAIAKASPVPVILYNVPGRTSSNINAETTLRLSVLKNILGIKEASGNIEQCMRIAHAMPSDFLLISGDDLLTAALYAMGGSGVISVLANAFPGVFKQMKLAVMKGNFKKAAAAQFELLDINSLMYEEGNPVGIKQALKEIGVCENYTRLPMVPASQNLRKKIRAVLQKNLKKKG